MTNDNPNKVIATRSVCEDHISI